MGATPPFCGLDRQIGLVLGGLIVIYIRKVFDFAQKLGLAGGHELPLGQLGHEDEVAPGLDMLYFAQSKRE